MILNIPSNPQLHLFYQYFAHLDQDKCIKSTAISNCNIYIIFILNKIWVYSYTLDWEIKKHSSKPVQYKLRTKLFLEQLHAYIAITLISILKMKQFNILLKFKIESIYQRNMSTLFVWKQGNHKRDCIRFIKNAPTDKIWRFGIKNRWLFLV